MRATRQAVAYLMGNSSGLGFRSVIWSQIRLVSEVGEFTPLYKGGILELKREGKLDGTNKEIAS